MATYPSLCSPCVTYRTLCHSIGHQVLPTTPCMTSLDALQDAMPCQRSLTLIPREQRVSLGWQSTQAYASSLTLCNQYTTILGLYLYISILEKFLLVVKTLIKKYRAATTLISNHKLLNNCSLKNYTETVFLIKWDLKLLPQIIHWNCFLHKMIFNNIGNNNEFSKCYFVLI